MSLNENNLNSKSENHKCKTCGHSTWKCFQDYSGHTSIHGVQYLGEDERPWWEKLFWLIVLVISVSICIHNVYSEWKKWNESPVIVSFDDHDIEVWQIPFPAVTICPQSKFNNDISRVTTQESLSQLFEMNTKLQNNICPKFSNKELNEPNEVEPVENGNFVNSMREYLPTTHFSCKWQNKIIDCSSIFNEIVTDDGLCYNFNGLIYNDLYYEKREPLSEYFTQKNKNKANWNRENGFTSETDIKTYPRRVFGSGRKHGLEIVMEQPTNEIDKYLCKHNNPGYKILIHSPDNTALVQRRYIHVPFNQELTITVRPNTITTSEGLRSYSKEKRRCAFTDEIKLSYFKTYTKINCEMECYANRTFEICNCISFYMPSIPNSRLCMTKNDIKCTLNVKEELLRNEAYTIKNDNTKEKKYVCQCDASCNSIDYSLETSQTIFDIQKHYKEITEEDGNNEELENKFNNLNWSDIEAAKSLLFESGDKLHEKILLRNLINSNNSVLQKVLHNHENITWDMVSTNVSASKLFIYLAEDSFLSSKRSELYGLSSFLSNMGGLLGLFMGISALSFIEIIYFSSMRIISNHFKNRKNKRNLQQDIKL